MSTSLLRDADQPYSVRLDNYLNKTRDDLRDANKAWSFSPVDFFEGIYQVSDLDTASTPAMLADITIRLQQHVPEIYQSLVRHDVPYETKLETYTHWINFLEMNDINKEQVVDTVLGYADHWIETELHDAELSCSLYHEALTRLKKYPVKNLSEQEREYLRDFVVRYDADVMSRYAQMLGTKLPQQIEYENDASEVLKDAYDMTMELIPKLLPKEEAHPHAYRLYASMKKPVAAFTIPHTNEPNTYLQSSYLDTALRTIGQTTDIQQFKQYIFAEVPDMTDYLLEQQDSWSCYDLYNTVVEMHQGTELQQEYLEAYGSRLISNTKTMNNNVAATVLTDISNTFKIDEDHVLLATDPYNDDAPLMATLFVHEDLGTFDIKAEVVCLFQENESFMMRDYTDDRDSLIILDDAHEAASVLTDHMKLVQKAATLSLNEKGVHHFGEHLHRIPVSLLRL